MDKRAEQILTFWFDEVGQKGWFESTPQLDNDIRLKFEQLWGFAARGDLDSWICKPLTSLALVLLLDQFPRNMFRDDPKAFSTDEKAMRITKRAIDLGHDQRVDLPGRLFFYMPFMHSEMGTEQDRSVRKFVLAKAETQILHARAHRWVIRKFGRFPYRNAALGRKSSPAEQDFLDNGGYQRAMEAVSA